MKNNIRIKAGCLIVIFISFLSCKRYTFSRIVRLPGSVKLWNRYYIYTTSAVDIARYSECRYIVAGIYGTEILDELGNILPSWEDNGMRVPSTRGFNLQ